MVASRRRRRDETKKHHVSIPFIAGQWSLPWGHGNRNNPNNRLNPLHCGAVVASFPLWTLIGDSGSSLNPLHCGAVVASVHPAERRGERGLVSIPFIAGQWSLPIIDDGGLLDAVMSQSPSLRGSGRFRRSSPAPRSPYGERSQSPSLRGSGRFRPRSAPTSPRNAGLNPLHCGAVVASSAAFAEPACAVASQSPSLRGSGRFRSRAPAFARGRQVSIPFIAGQWSLPCAGPCRPCPPSGSQSPSLRGSGRFPPPPSPHGGRRNGSQSPSLRGSGRFSSTRWKRRCRGAGLNPLHCGAVVASRPPPHGGGARRGCLNPLHCGAVVASRRRPTRRPTRRSVSIPFIAGQWSLLAWNGRVSPMPKKVSIPFIAGQWSLRRPAPQRRR